MRRSAGPLAMALLLGCCAASCAGGLGSARQQSLVGQAAPRMELRTFDGRPVRLIEPGRPTLVVLLASWCAPCRVEASRLVDVAKRYRARGLRTIGVAVLEPEGAEAVRRFAEERGIPFPIAMGTPESVQALGGGRITPAAFVVGPDGRIEAQVVGMREMPGLEAVVSRVLDAG